MWPDLGSEGEAIPWKLVQGVGSQARRMPLKPCMARQVSP